MSRQVILTSALEGSAFDVPHVEILNRITQVSIELKLTLSFAHGVHKYGYLGALVACFIFGMGNRPQG